MYAMFISTSVFSTELTHSLEDDSRNLAHSEDVLVNINIGNNFNHDQVSSTASHNNNSVTREILVYCQNFNRMRSAYKINEIHKKMSSSPFMVVLATETSWDKSVHSEEVFGNRYNVFRNDRNYQLSETRSGGGVLIAISTEFNAEIIPTTEFKEFEHVWVQAIIAGETHVFVSVYIPPDKARKETYEKKFQSAEDVLSSLAPEVKVHVYGDFNQRNVNFILDIDNESILMPIVGENETLQFIFDKTTTLGLNQINHVKNEQGCYLDLLFTNIHEDFSVTNSLAPLWKNEVFHTAIEYSLFVHENSRPNDIEYEETFDFQSANYNSIKNKIRDINWQDALRDVENVETAVEIFYEKLFEIITDEVPLKRKRRQSHSKHPIWYNRKIINLRNRKQKAHKTYKYHKSELNLINYLNTCDQLNLEINTAFEEHRSKTELEIKSCPKNFFKYVKSKLKSDNFPSRMHLDNNTSDNTQGISNLFATFFQEIYTTFTDEDRDYDFFTHFPDFSNDVSVNQVSVSEILEVLQSLDASKGPGPDGIPPLFVKNLAVELTTPLFWLFNMSLESGSFPISWKKSFLVPIFKSGNRSDVRNYRGIAIISCIPKVFEAIINKKIFLQIKNRISHSQHGFFKGRSTTTNLLEFINFSLNAMDNGNYVEALYTDFSKAFDRVDIPMLVFKLQKMGFHPNLLIWIESYLTNRQQTVKFKSTLSSPIQVTSGVPQGSHLGPLLFILFINDSTFILKNIKILIYADDMKLYLEIKNNKDIDIFCSEIKLFYKWCIKSLLQLNVKKCISIAFRRKRSIPQTTFFLGEQAVEKCQQVRDLGMILDSKLTFIEHYNTIINKANNMLSFIKRFCYNFRDPYTIKTLYILRQVNSRILFHRLVSIHNHPRRKVRIGTKTVSSICPSQPRLGGTSSSVICGPLQINQYTNTQGSS